MKIADVGPYEVHLPTSGGKAGKGHNKTSTIQVMLGGQLLKQIRFNVADEASRSAASAKARSFILEHHRSRQQQAAHPRER